MAKYTQLEPYEIKSLAQRYGIEVSKYSPIEAGGENSSFLLNSDGGEHVLTISDGKPVEDVHRLVQLLDHLAQYDFPTSRVLLSVNGEKVTLYGDKAVTVKEYIPGRTLWDFPEEGLYSLGTTLAYLHRIPAPDFMHRTHPYGIDHFSKAFGVQIDLQFEGWLEAKTAYLRKELPADLPRGLIHGDVFKSNLIFQNGEFHALIDFEDASEYYKVFDPACAIYATCLEVDLGNFGKARHILRGYQQIRKLGDAERAALQLFVIYAGTASAFWQYMKYNVYTPTEEKKDSHQRSAERVEEIMAIPREEFNRVFQ
jgi:homoserine kinase type II